MAIALLIFDLDKCIFDTFSMPLTWDGTFPIPATARTYGDEHHLERIPVRKLLVTAGFHARQLGKIKASNIAHLFYRYEIVATAEDKRAAFKVALFELGIPPYEVIAIGDNPRSELGIGRDLGMITVQTLRPGVRHWPEADHHIQSFAELPALVQQIEHGES